MAGVGGARGRPPPPPCCEHAGSSPAGFTPSPPRAEGGQGAEARPHRATSGCCCVAGPQPWALERALDSDRSRCRSPDALCPASATSARGHLYALVMRPMWHCHPSRLVSPLSPPEHVPLTSIFGKIIFPPVVIVKGPQDGGHVVGGA